jgi:histidinol phosphatase-like PHP family hydrolase
VLVPAEVVRRARVAGYTSMAFTDHADASNLEIILSGQAPLVREYSAHAGIDLFAGVEITHVPPALIPDTVARARSLGAQIVVVHGETISEPVERGANLAAIRGGCDILAHPGLITLEEAELASEKGVCLEITTRKSNALTNGHVAAMARRTGAKLVINNDAHEPGDFVSAEMRKAVALGAGLSDEEYRQAEANSREIVGRLIRTLGGPVMA